MQAVIDKTCRNDILIVMGDFNAKVGTERDEDERHVLGKFSKGNRNNAGVSLVAFCMEDNLVIANTMFRQHPVVISTVYIDITRRYY